MGFSQWLVFVQRDEKGEAVIRREYLGSEFTVGSQELDTISLAGSADVKGGCGCHTWEPPNSRPACPCSWEPGRWKTGDSPEANEQRRPCCQGLGPAALLLLAPSAGLELAAVAVSGRGLAEPRSWIWGLWMSWIRVHMSLSFAEFPEKGAPSWPAQLDVPLLFHNRWASL